MRRHPMVSLFLGIAVLVTLLASVQAEAQVTALTLAVDKPSPQQVGTTLTFTATATGDGGPFEYKFWLSKGTGAYVPATADYVPENTMVWTATEANSYRVIAYARTPGSTVLYEKSATKTGYWVVTEAPLTAVTLSSTKASPQQVGTTLSFSAAASSAGGGSAPEYQFWLASGGGAYRLVKDYSIPGDTWTPGVGDMDVADSYVVKVNARNQGSIAPFEKYATKDFVMMADAPVKSVTLTADKTSPQDLSTIGTVTFTALATPGVPGGAVEYRFWLYTSASAKYVPVGDTTTEYSSARTWHWTPTVEDNYYRVMVYARTVGSTVAYEKLKVVYFSVVARPPTLGDLTPSVLFSPAGSARTISAVFSDPDGYAGLKIVSLLVNETQSEANGIYVRYDRSIDRLHLTTDAGTSYVGNCVPGSAGTLTNSQGTLNCADSSVVVSGNDLTVTWSITPKAAFISATAKNIYAAAMDNTTAKVGWVDKGDWTITTSTVDVSDCVGCHGNPPHVGNDGIAGTADDAPNVMGNGTNPAGVGATPKPFDDGTWGYSVNGHGANGTAPHSPRDVYGDSYLLANAKCTDCHDVSVPAGTHLDGVLNSVEGKHDQNGNTAHLIAAFIGASSPEWAVQVKFDDTCYAKTGCHIASMSHRHAKDSDPAAKAVRFGDGGTVIDGESIRFPVDSDLSTNASPGGRDFAPCISCHNPHGTAVFDPGKPTNRMLRDIWTTEGSALCKECHR